MYAKRTFQVENVTEFTVTQLPVGSLVLVNQVGIFELMIGEHQADNQSIFEAPAMGESYYFKKQL